MSIFDSKWLYNSKWFFSKWLKLKWFYIFEMISVRFTNFLSRLVLPLKWPLRFFLRKDFYFHKVCTCYNILMHFNILTTQIWWWRNGLWGRLTNLTRLYTNDQMMSNSNYWATYLQATIVTIGFFNAFHSAALGSNPGHTYTLLQKLKWDFLSSNWENNVNWI